MTPLEFIEANRQPFLDELYTFLRYPTISTASEYKADIRACGEWLADKARALGFMNVKLNETAGHPIDQLEKAINRVYSTGFYERVGYKLRDNAEGNDLVVKVVEKKTDLLRFGFHYDSDIKAAAILNVTLRNIAWRGTMTTLDIVLGNAEHYNLSHYVMTDSRPRFGMQFLLDHERTDMMTQTEYSPYTELRVRNSRAEIYAGTLYSTSFVGGGGVEFDYNTVDVRNPVIGQPVRTTESFYTIRSLRNQIRI